MIINGNFGSPPKFAPCTDCGEPTSGGSACFECTRRKIERSEAKHRTEASLPERFAWATFEDADLLKGRTWNHAIDRCKQSVGADRVTLVGGTGRGKTSLVVAMVREWLKTGPTKPGMFVLATDLARCRMTSKLGKEPELVIEALWASLLVLDDMGAGNLPAGPIEDVLLSRYERNKPTWITTWMNDKTMGERFGGALARRVFEGARLIDFGGAR